MSWRVVAVVVLTSWGALTFGAVYPWAYQPLFAGCAIAGTAALLQRTGNKTAVLLPAVTLALVIAAIGAQLIPIPVDRLHWLSPEADVFLRRFEIGYPAELRHTPSIQPSLTVVALLATIALSVWLVGLLCALTRDDALNISRGVTILGVVLAVEAMAQKAMWNGKIYGFWTPMEIASPFGVFVNRNHFAGWMLMALPLSIGYFTGRVARGMRQVKPGLRNRIVWFSSAEASETILVGFAAIVMALALMLSLSRSGMLSLLVALMIFGWVARRHSSGSRRSFAAACLLVGALAVAWWTGFDRLADRFAENRIGDPGERLEIWADTWHLATRFPFVGTGLNTYGTATVLYQTVDLKEHLAQAHNDYLQLLAEGGLLVCIPIALAIMAFISAVRRRFRDVSQESLDYWIRMGAVTGILGIAMQEISDFSLQMPGNAVLFTVLLALAARPSSSPVRRTPVRA